MSSCENPIGLETLPNDISEHRLPGEGGVLGVYENGMVRSTNVAMWSIFMVFLHVIPCCMIG